MNTLRILEQDILNCTACSLRQGAKDPVPGIGPSKKVKAMIIGRNPGNEEDVIGRPFVGPSGKVLREAFKRLNVNIDEECYTSNLAKCYNIKEPTEKQYKTCRDLFLFKEIEEVNPEFVLLLGSAALKSIFPSFTAVTKKRGQLLQHPDFPNINFFATFHPSAILRDLNKERFFRADLLSFWNFVQEGVPDKKEVTYTIKKSPQNVHNILKFLMEKDLLAFDIETTGLDPFADDFKITLISFSDGPYRSFVIPVNYTLNKEESYTITPANMELLKQLLENPNIKKIAHNAIFDMKCLKAEYGIKVQGIHADTQIMPYIYDGSLKMQSLKNLAAEYTDLGHYEEELLLLTGQKKLSAEIYKTAPFDLLSKYAAKDTDATYRIYLTFLPYFSDERLDKLRRFYNEIIPCLVDLELEGWVIDKEYSADEILKEERKNLIRELYKVPAVRAFSTDAFNDLKQKAKLKCNNQFISWRVRLKKDPTQDKVDIKKQASIDKYTEYIKSITLEDVINFNSSDQKALLITKYANIDIPDKTPGGKPSVKKETLTRLALSSPLCGLLLKYAHLSKLISTYTVKMFDQKSDDGKLRTNYNCTSTFSSRLSSSKPNLQNIPARGDYSSVIKKQFICAPGYTLLEGDYGQIELRLIAVYAQEEVMLHAYRNNLDLHRISASTFYNIPEDEINDDQRYVGKTCNFGLGYGTSHYTLRSILLTDGGVDLSESEAKRIHSAYFKKYPGIKRYHKAIEKYVIDHGYIDTKFGFRRNLPDAYSLNSATQAAAFREAYNHPIQGTAAGILFEALVRTRKVLENTQAKIVATIHDSIFLYVPDDKVMEYARVLKYCMEDMSYPWLTLKIPVDIKAGKSWGEIEELSL